MKYHLLSFYHQSGLHTSYSTQDVLLHVTDKWLRAVNEGQYTGAILLDLAKAFTLQNKTGSTDIEQK